MGDVSRARFCGEASGIAGNLVQVFLYSHNTISAGASGAIMGLYGMALYMAIKGTLSVAVRNQVIILFVVNLVYGFSTPNIGNGAHIGGFFAGLLLAEPVLQIKRISYRHVVNVLGVTTTILSVVALLLAYNDIKYAENPFNILGEITGASLPGLNSTSGQGTLTNNNTIVTNGTVSTTSNTTSNTAPNVPSNVVSNTAPSPSVHPPDPVKQFQSEFNKILEDYTKVRNEYNQYHGQYVKGAITEAKYYNDISSLVAPLEFDGTQLRYLEVVAPANAKRMTQKLNDSETNFYGYMEILSYSLKISSPTKANHGLTYITQSNQDFQKFKSLYQTYVKGK